MVVHQCVNLDALEKCGLEVMTRGWKRMFSDVKHLDMSDPVLDLVTIGWVATSASGRDGVYGRGNSEGKIVPDGLSVSGVLVWIVEEVEGVVIGAVVGDEDRDVSGAVLGGEGWIGRHRELCNFGREEKGISRMGPNKLGKGHDMRGA